MYFLTAGVGVGLSVGLGVGLGVVVGLGVGLGVGLAVGLGVALDVGLGVEVGPGVGAVAGMLKAEAADFLIAVPVAKKPANVALTFSAAGPLPRSFLYCALPVSNRF